MKVLSALFTALVVVGFAGMASAQCAGYERSAQTAVSQPVVVPPAVGS